MKIESRVEGIKEELWREVVNNNKYIVSIHEFENSEIESYNYAILKIGKSVFGRLLWDWEKQEVGIELHIKYLPKTYKALEKIASELGGKFYIKKNEVFDAKKHLPAPTVEIDRSQQYFENYELDNIRWLGFREENQEEILQVLKLQEGKSGQLIELLNINEPENFVITPPYKGWTFIIGNKLPALLINGDENSTEEALSNLCKSLQKLSKRFIEVQFYEHEEKSNITGYFKANNGKLIYGYWRSEMEEFTKGRLPKELKKIHPSTAHEVASIWSIDSLDFVFIEAFVKEESNVVVQ